MTLTDDQLKVVIKANFEPIMKQLAAIFEHFRKQIQKWYPWIRWATEAHRAEVKRVHTAYARTRRARRRRKR